MGFSSSSDFPFPTRGWFEFARGPFQPAPPSVLVCSLLKPAYSKGPPELCLALSTLGPITLALS